MSELTRIHFLQYGKHASASDWTSTPSPLKFLRATNNPTIDITRAAVERNYQTGNNENIPSLTGLQGLAISDISVPIEGLSGGGAGDGIDSSTLDTTTSEFLECLTGSTVTDNTGDTSSAVAQTGTTVQVDGTPGAPVSLGGGIMFAIPVTATQTSATMVAREVVSFADPDYTVDRNVTDDTGATTGPDVNTEVFAAKTYVVTNMTDNPIHLYFDSETEGDRATIFGCMSNANLSFPAGQNAQLGLSGIQMTEASNPAKANPTYSAPVTGSEIVVGDCPFWIGGTLFQAYDFSLDLGNTVVQRRNDGQMNGVSGYIVSNRMPVLSGKIRKGALSGPDEASLAEMDVIRGVGAPPSDFAEAPTNDIALQMGRNPGSTCYMRMPAARINFTQTDDNGQRVFSFTATGTESPNHASVPGALRIHIF